MQVVVVGAGYTGRRVLQRLGPAAGLALTRPEFDLDKPPPAIPRLKGNYQLLYTVPPRPVGDTDQRLATLLSLLDPRPERLVYLSTTGVYGGRDGKRVDETTEPAPATERAARRVAAESLLTTWCIEHDTELVILRVPGIYGPDRLGIERLRNAAPVIAETDAGPGNRIHVDDLVSCCIRALDREAPAGIYNVGDGDHRSTTSFAKSVARLAGIPAPPEVSRAEAEQTFSDARLSFLRESRIVDTRQMRDVLGVVPRYTDPEAGIRASLA
jgi:nucleoside-diphosphate-sugar epimerase